MTTEEAIRECEFWTTNIAETQAWGTTRNPMIGLHFPSDEYQAERWTAPERRGWAITIPRWHWNRNEDGERVRTENLLYQMIVKEIQRRYEQGQ